MRGRCRLCMGSELLVDLSTIDGDVNFKIKTVSCIGIQIAPDDGLPTQICNMCKETIFFFFNFKQKCLEVDLKLRALANFQFQNTKKCDVDSNTHYKYIDIGQIPSGSNIVNIGNSACEITKRNKNNDRFSEAVFNKSKHIENSKSTQSKFQCEICGKVFKIKAGLENHILTHSGLKPFQCKLCPKRYCRLESVTIHMRSHAGIKPYVCEICGKTSTKHQDLIRHMKVHSDKRNYMCPRCGRNFKRSSDVSSHMRTHTGIRPYQCKTCKKTYTSHSGLRKHYKSHCKKEVI